MLQHAAMACLCRVLGGSGDSQLQCTLGVIAFGVMLACKQLAGPPYTVI